MKEYIIYKLVQFQEEYPDFDDRNSEHIEAARKLSEELSHDFPQNIIIEAIEERGTLLEKEVMRARELFLEKVREATRKAGKKAES